MKWIKVFGLGLAILAIASMTGCTTGEQSKKEVQELTIGLMPDTDSLPFLVAEKSGYFEQEGVKVHLQYFKSAMDRDAALQSGNIDGAVSDMLAAAFLKSGGFDVKITSATVGNYSLVAAGNSGVKKIRDLEGKDVAVSRNTIIEYATDAMLTHENMKEDAIEKVVIPQIPTRLEVLKNGQIAAATLPEPMASIAVVHGGVLIDSSERLGINPGVMIFTSKSLKAQPEAIRSMYRAYNRAVGELNAQPSDKSMDIAIENLSFPPEVKGVLKLPIYNTAQLPQEKDLVSSVEWLNRKGLVKEQYSYQDLVDRLLEN